MLYPLLIYQGRNIPQAQRHACCLQTSHDPGTVADLTGPWHNLTLTLIVWVGSVCKYVSSVIHLIHLPLSTDRKMATIGDGVFPTRIFQIGAVRVPGLQFVFNMDQAGRVHLEHECPTL